MRHPQSGHPINLRKLDDQPVVFDIEITSITPVLVSV